MITYNADFQSAVSQPNTVKDWLLTLDYGAGTPGTLYFSTQDRNVVGKFWRGTVLDWGRITEKIDLSKSKSTVGDITIKLANSYPNASGTLSAELFGGSKYFLNQDCEISEWAPGIGTGDNPTIYEGRLKDIKHDASTVTLVIERRYPWDRIRVPQVKTAEGKYFPVIYGGYTPETSTVASPQFCTSAIVWPMPVNEIAGSYLYGLVHEAITGSDGRAHFYEKNLNIFIPLEEQDSNSESYKTGNAIRAAVDLERAFQWNLFTESEASEWDDFANAIETGSNWTSATGEQIGSGDNNESWIGDTLSPDGYANSIDIDLDYEIEITSVGVGDAGESMTLRVFVGGSQVGAIPVRTGADGVGTTSGSWSYTATTEFQLGSAPRISINGEWDCTAGPQSVAGQFRVNNLRITGTYVINADNEPEAVNNKLQSINHLYCGADGFDKSYTGYSGTALDCHSIFRDMLNRYLDIDFADDSGGDEDIDGWTALETARSGYQARVFHDEPVQLSQILQKLQYEGAFIWMQRNDTARTVFVKTSYSAGDINIAFTGADLTAVKVSHTPWESIVTSRTYHYDKHPATGDYKSSATETNSNRTDWNFGAVGADAENQEDVDLDYLTDPTGLKGVYDLIDGEPHLEMSATVLATKHHCVEPGDIVTFASMPYEPFGDSWSGKYFMVLDVGRKPNQVTIKCREVG